MESKTGTAWDQVKNTTHEPRDWPKTNRTRFWEILTRVHLWIVIWLSNVLFCFLLHHLPTSIPGSVHCFALLLRSLFALVFCLFLLPSIFHYVQVSSHSVQWLCAPGYVRTNHARITTTAVLSVDFNSMGHKTGTHQDQVKKTRLPPQNSYGALAPWSYPDLIPPGLELSKLDLDTSKYIICRREVCLWVIVPQKRAT